MAISTWCIAGSICGESICGVSTGGGAAGTTVVSTTGGGGVSPTCSVPPATITVPPTSTTCSILATSPRPIGGSLKRGSSPALENPGGGGSGTPVTLSTVKERRKRSSSSGSSGPVSKPRRIKHRSGKGGSSRPTSGDSRLTATDNSAATTTGGGSSGFAGDVSSVGGSSSLAPVAGGGVRVSGRVKVVSSEDGDRFILDTGDGTDTDMNLGDAIFSLLGLRMSMNPEEMKKLGSLNSITGSILTDNTISKDLGELCVYLASCSAFLFLDVASISVFLGEKEKSLPRKICSMHDWWWSYWFCSSVEVDVTGDETGAVAIDIGEPGQPAVVVSPPPPELEEDGSGGGGLPDENASDAASDSSGEADATTALASKNGESERPSLPDYIFMKFQIILLPTGILILTHYFIFCVHFSQLLQKDGR